MKRRRHWSVADEEVIGYFVVEKNLSVADIRVNVYRVWRWAALRTMLVGLLSVSSPGPSKISV
jgi:hypothetical protein